MEKLLQNDGRLFELGKLILSRKGFDSDSGYGYSPYDPETGKYIVIPIPEDEIEGRTTRYKDLKLKRNHFENISAENMHDLIYADSLKYSLKTKSVVKNSFAHFDPMLGECPWLKNMPMVGAFGQSEAAAGHLKGKKVGKGSIFLFYSRFVPINGGLHPLDPSASWNKGVYYIYGWLKVAKVIENYFDLPEDVINANHPHSTESDFKSRKNNTIYLAAEKLFDDLNIPGCGYFPRLVDRQRLSSELHKNIPSIWRLPAFFYEDRYRPTYLNKRETAKDRWLLFDDETCFVQTTGRGQEYITNLDEVGLKWIRNFFDNERNKY